MKGTYPRVGAEISKQREGEEEEGEAFLKSLIALPQNSWLALLPQA